VIGMHDRIDGMIVELKKSGFKLKLENYLTDYSSCQSIEKTELEEILILQPHLINTLEAKFGDEVKN
jgi:hypothetical protein